jgi:hypothetical protein
VIEGGRQQRFSRRKVGIDQRQIDRQREFWGVYVAGPSSLSNVAAPEKSPGVGLGCGQNKGYHRGVHFRCKMGDEESRLVELDKVGEGWVSEEG